MASIPLPTFRNLITNLEARLNKDFKNMLSEVLIEEHKTGWVGTWRAPVIEANTFVTQIKKDLLELYRLQNENKLDRQHEKFLGDLYYRLSLLEKAEQRFQHFDPSDSKEIRKIVEDMKDAVRRIMKALR